MQGDGSWDAISTTQFSAESWLKTTVPNTVLAAQVKAGVFPDPYFGDNLRKIPGTSYPVGHNFSNLPMPTDSPYACSWWYRKEFNAPALSAKDDRLWLHFGGINYRGEVSGNGHKIADSALVAGAYRTYDFDITEFVVRDKANVIAVKTSAPTEKDLGINWVDWNPCPPDKDMGLWGPVSLVETGSVTVRSPLVVTHFSDGSLSRADLTVYAELHNASSHPVKGILPPEQLPALASRSPSNWPRTRIKLQSLAPSSFPLFACRILSPGGLARWVNRTSNK